MYVIRGYSTAPKVFVRVCAQIAANGCCFTASREQASMNTFGAVL
jgi:hypothetical protein